MGVGPLQVVLSMVLILDGNLEHDAHVVWICVKHL